MGKMNVKVIGGEVFDLPKRERAKKFDGETVIGLAVMLGDLRAEQERRASAGSEIAARGSRFQSRLGMSRPRRFTVNLDLQRSLRSWRWRSKVYKMLQEWKGRSNGDECL